MDTRTFAEVFSDVKDKLEKGIPMLTAKEEWCEDVILDAVELFGYDFIFSESNEE